MWKVLFVGECETTCSLGAFADVKCFRLVNGIRMCRFGFFYFGVLRETIR